MKMTSGRDDRVAGSEGAPVTPPGQAPVSCAEARDRLPLCGPGDARPAELAAHLEGCPDCAAEAGFVARMRETRPEPPATILSGVLERARLEAEPTHPRWGRRPRWRDVAWALPAAAAVVLFIGIEILSNPGPEPPWSLALEAEPEIWYGDEWVVAGGPVPEALSDELLMALLEEMDP